MHCMPCQALQKCCYIAICWLTPNICFCKARSMSSSFTYSLCLVIGTPHLASIAFSTPTITISVHWYCYSSFHSRLTYYATYNKKWPHFKEMKVWFYHQFIKGLFQCTEFVFNCNHSTIKLLIKCLHIMECQNFNW
jgi:hypothetical protein